MDAELGQMRLHPGTYAEKLLHRQGPHLGPHLFRNVRVIEDRQAVGLLHLGRHLGQ
nr:hypothetical protein [Moorella mulderi]